MDDSTWKILLIGGTLLCLVAPLARYILIRMKDKSEVKSGHRLEKRLEEIQAVDAETEARRKQRHEMMQKFESTQEAKLFKKNSR